MKRQEIARITLNLLAEEGFTVSVNRIAQEAGLSKGSLYVYFDSRDELILCALKDWTDQLIQYAGGSLESMKDTPERFRDYCSTITEGFVKDPRALKILVAVVQMSFEDKSLFEESDALAQYIGFFRKAVVEIIESGVKAGVFAPESAKSPQVTAINILAFLDGLALHYWMGRDFDIEEQVNAFVDRMLGTRYSESSGAQ